MALTALEQQKLISGEVSPNQTDLRSLVKQAGFIKGLEFKRNYKEFDMVSEAKAASYLNKMFSIINSGIRGNGQTQEGAFRIMVAIIGSVPLITLPIIESATDAQWEQFVADNIIEALEIVADVRKDEKAAYEAI